MRYDGKGGKEKITSIVDRRTIFFGPSTFVSFFQARQGRRTERGEQKDRRGGERRRNGSKTTFEMNGEKNIFFWKRGREKGLVSIIFS